LNIPRQQKAGEEALLEVKTVQGEHLKDEKSLGRDGDGSATVDSLYVHPD
jgi:hypothetical protein